MYIRRSDNVVYIHAVDLGSATPTDTSGSSRLMSSAVEVWDPFGRTGSIPDSTLFSFMTSSMTAVTQMPFGGQRSAVWRPKVGRFIIFPTTLGDYNTTVAPDPAAVDAIGHDPATIEVRKARTLAITLC